MLVRTQSSSAVQKTAKRRGNPWTTLFASIALASFGLQACNGTSNTGGPVLPSATSTPALGSSVGLQTGSVQLPGGTQVALTSLVVHNSLDAQPVSSSG